MEIFCIRFGINVARAIPYSYENKHVCTCDDKQNAALLHTKTDIFKNLELNIKGLCHVSSNQTGFRTNHQ